MRRIALPLAAFLLSTSLLAQYLPSRQASIDVSGSAAINVPPDEIVIGLGVETFAPTVEASSTRNDEAIRNIILALKGLGVADTKIKTEAMTLDLSYRDSSHPSAGVEGYFARKTLTVTLGDATLAEKAVSAALRNGANRLMGIQYNTTRLRELRDEAREKASRAALEKARLLAGQFGARIGAPLSIREGYSMLYSSSMWNPYGYYGGQNVQQNVSVSRTDESSGEATTIPAGQMAVRAEVSVSFELLPGAAPQ